MSIVRDLIENERITTPTKVADATLADEAISFGQFTGYVLPFATSTVPSGFLECNGSALSRTTYADLFAVIGTTYGTGDGSTTFNIPDLRGEFIRGWDDGRGVDSGRTIGTVQADEFASHSHDNYALGGAMNTLSSSSGNTAFQGPNQTNVVYSPSLKTSAAGGIETRPRNIAMMYVIKY